MPLLIFRHVVPDSFATVMARFMCTLHHTTELTDNKIGSAFA